MNFMSGFLVWTQKSAVQKSSVDVNISYYIACRYQPVLSQVWFHVFLILFILFAFCFHSACLVWSPPFYLIFKNDTWVTRPHFYNSSSQRGTYHHEELDFYSASSQKSPDRHVAPLRNIIPIPSQPSFLCVCKIQEPNDNACVHMNLPSIHRPC